MVHEFCYDMLPLPCHQELLGAAPLHLQRLLFQGPETTFLENVDIAEKTLEQQRQALEQKANVKDILRKHKVSDKKI